MVLRAMGYTCLFFILVLITVLSYKSNIWQQNIFFENKAQWTKINAEWTVREDKGINDSCAVTISKVFFPDDIARMAGNEDGSGVKNAAYLFFITHNQNVRIFKDSGTGDELIYSFGNNGTQIVGSESGNALHCIPLPDSGNREMIITMQLFPSFQTSNLSFYKLLFKNRVAVIPEIYCGNHSVCIESYFKSCISQLIPILFIFAMSFASLFITLIALLMRKTVMKQFFYWGLFAFFCASGFLLESKAALYFAPNSFSLYFLSTVIITLLPLFFMLYMRGRASFTSVKVLSRVFTVGTPINVLLVCVCACCTFIPFVFVRYYVCFVLDLFCLLMMVVVGHEVTVSCHKPQLFDIAVFFAGSCILLDFIISFFVHSRIDVFFFSRIGMVVFFVACGINLVVNFFDSELLKARSSVIEKSAYTDILTGCLNTAALWRDNRKLHLEQKGFALALVTIQNISDINSKSGYTAGDEAVKMVAQTLCTIFSKATVYRLSGTKFCILLQENEINTFKEKFDELLFDVDNYNKKSLALPIKINGSAGIFNRSVDIDFDGIYIRLWEQLKLSTN